MTSVQINMAYFKGYQHFQGDNPPWPALFGWTCCYFGNLSVESSVPSTINTYCTVLSIIITSVRACITVVCGIVLLPLFSEVSVWCKESASRWHIIVNIECCGNSTPWPMARRITCCYYACRRVLCNLGLVYCHKFHTIQSTGVMCCIVSPKIPNRWIQQWVRLALL